jgi:cytoskeletal protein CcmA (bactofilin family)
MKLDNILNAAIRKDSFLVPKEMVINGSFRSDTPGQVAGIVNGDISCKGRILILKDGIVNGDITAEELLVYGKINGNVKGCNKITVQSGAVIKGNINTSEIHIEKEAHIEGLITKSGLQVVLSNKTETARKHQDDNDKIEAAKPDQPVKERQSWF